MKALMLGITILVSVFVSFSGNPVSRVYTAEELKNPETIHGSSAHLSELKFNLNSIDSKSVKDLSSDKSETLLIVKDGELAITLNGSEKVVGPGSVALVLAGDKISVSANDEASEFYLMQYISKKKNADYKESDSKSMILDFEDIEFHEHDKGGIREYYNLSTPQLSYSEMHVTNLNGNIKSHEPHTHSAAEMVLMVKGHTQMQIGDEFYKGNAGDVYFLASDIPHAIENLEDEQCIYFAFQWEL